MAAHLRAQTDDKAPAGRAGKVPPDLGDGHRRARERDRDAGVQFDALGRNPGDREREERVVLVLHRDDAVIAFGLGGFRRRRHAAQIRLRHRREYTHHRLPY
jgi:hypothetical protein